MIQFAIMGEPQGKGRPRFARSGHTYTPEKTAAYEKVANERRTGEKQPREADFAHLSQDRIEAIMGQKYGDDF